MPTKAITPRLAESLNRRLLAASQLQTQAARSVALDAGALGVMTVDFAAAANFGARGAYDLGILALVLLGLSFGLAVRTLSSQPPHKSAPPSRTRRKFPRARTSTPPRTRSSTTSRTTSRPTNMPSPRKEPSFNGALTARMSGGEDNLAPHPPAQSVILLPDATLLNARV